MSDTAVEGGQATDARKIAMGFKNFSVATENPTTALVYNVTGYVEKGCVTAVMGASAAGKEVAYSVSTDCEPACLFRQELVAASTFWTYSRPDGDGRCNDGR